MGLKKNSKFFNFDRLYKECTKKFPNQEKDILISMNKLIEQKLIVQGGRISREGVLKNQKRREIYDFITKNPGTHFRELLQAFSIGRSLRRHLFMLEKFRFIRNRKFQNKICYFKIETNPTEDVKYILLRNKIKKEIYSTLEKQGKARLNELSETLQLKHNKIQYHLKELIDTNLIRKESSNGISFYLIPKLEKRKQTA
ncbi:MAG: winged helix-turn-helix transcriptional regulator [Candidatus Helarchaeota archaeon]